MAALEARRRVKRAALVAGLKRPQLAWGRPRKRAKQDARLARGRIAAATVR